MGGYSNRKGKEHEKATRRYLERRGFERAERTSRGVAQPNGDIVGIPGFVIECKNLKDIARALREGVDQAVAAAEEGLDYPLAVVKRPLHGIEDAYAVMPLAEMVTLAKELQSLKRAVYGE